LVLHTSDVHLDRPGDAASRQLAAVVDLALQREVDCVIIAGDLFDHNRIKDEVVQFAVDQLSRLSVPVVILPGNHDCLVPGSVLRRSELPERCGHVRLFTEPEGETIDLPGLGVALWGKCIDTHDGDVRPMHGAPNPQKNGRWNIAVAHGYFVDNEQPLFPSYHITPDEIASTGWDYVALGHIPTFRCVSTEPVLAYYSGSPSVSGTVALVELDDEAGVSVAQCRLPGSGST
jgi:DNA repair exonuclease SbcCD nuclease subunit